MSTTVVEFENQDVIVVEMSGRGPIGPRGRQGEPGPAGPSEWGVISGNISDQTDLQNALDAKANVGDSYTKAEDDALLAQKADADSVYTKTETDSLLADKADTDDVYSKTDVNTLLSGKADSDTVYTKTETDTLLGAKADVGDSYTKTEEDTLLSAKANSADVYTKTQTDTLLADKADADTVYTKTETDSLLADKADTDSVYTKTETDTLLADKADSADVYTKDETDALLLDKAPVILNSASGSIASFTDGSASPVTALSVGIEPVQAGTGDPSPDNVRPISGHDTATVMRTGINIWDEEWELGTFDSNGQPSSSSTSIRCKNFIAVKPGQTYYMFSGSNKSNAPWMYGENKSFIRRSSAYYANQTFTIPSDVYYIKIALPATYGTTYNHDISINYPSSNHNYHQGNVQTVTIDLDGTRYGGTLNVLTGEMVVDRAIVDLGTLIWGYASQGFMYAYGISDVKSPSSSTEMVDILCSALKPTTANNVYNGGNGIGIHTNNAIRVRFPGMSTNPTTFKTAVSGWILVYPLATPLTVQLTPSQLSTLLGTNNIFADTGDVSVEYRADSKLYIDGVASATAKVTRQMIADSATADGKAPKSLATGDLIIVGDELRKATANIGNGSAITASNSTTATLADVIKALQ